MRITRQVNFGSSQELFVKGKGTGFLTICLKNLENNELSFHFSDFLIKDTQGKRLIFRRFHEVADMSIKVPAKHEYCESGKLYNLNVNEKLIFGGIEKKLPDEYGFDPEVAKDRIERIRKQFNLKNSN